MYYNTHEPGWHHDKWGWQPQRQTLSDCTQVGYLKGSNQQKWTVVSRAGRRGLKLFNSNEFSFIKCQCSKDWLEQCNYTWHYLKMVITVLVFWGFFFWCFKLNRDHLSLLPVLALKVCSSTPASWEVLLALQCLLWTSGREAACTCYLPVPYQLMHSSQVAGLCREVYTRYRIFFKSTQITS